LEDFNINDHDTFKRNLRVTPRIFDQPLMTLQNHPALSSNGTTTQLPIDHQLATALFRIWYHGSVTSNEGIAQWAGVSSGTVKKATRRVISAVLSLHDGVIKWPTEEGKEEASDWVQGVSCTAWRGGFCMAHGTLIALFEKPALIGEAYFDRKSNYSLNLQL
ncbi:hypothetical protein BZA77DRAFT_221680, partial [Pyronema omphalodes]